MAQKGGLRLNPSRGGKATEPVGASDAVAGDQDRQRVRPAGLPHRLRRGADPFGDLAVGPGFTARDIRHRPADGSVKAVPPCKGQVEAGQSSVEIGLHLPRRFVQKGRTLAGVIAPVQPHEQPAVLDQRDRPERRQDGLARRVGDIAHVTPARPSSAGRSPGACGCLHPAEPSSIGCICGRGRGGTRRPRSAHQAA